MAAASKTPTHISGLNMDNIIRYIIDADKKARSQVEAAQARQADAQRVVAEKKAALREQYMHRVEEKAAEMTQSEHHAAEEEFARSRTSYDTQLEKLMQIRTARFCEWVDTMTGRIVGDVR